MSEKKTGLGRGLTSLLGEDISVVSELKNEGKNIKIIPVVTGAGNVGKIIAGVDEVGRGCLAGPVMAAAVILPRGIYIPQIKDSKKLSKKRREALYPIIQRQALTIGIGISDVDTIEQFNIREATFIAMKDAISKLDPKPEKALIDGERIKDLLIPNEGIKGGDNKVDALISSGNIGVGAAFTATVSSSGVVTGLTTSNAGSGYSGSIVIKIAPPVGVGTTATATATLSNGVVTSTTITEGGTGYTSTNPPLVIASLPPFQTEKINTIENVEGYTGIITGIQQTTRTGGKPAIKFFFNAVTQNSSGVLANVDADKLKVGYPILVSGTKVGNGLTSINGVNASVVGIGTTFVDNIYIVKTIAENGSTGEIVCDVHTNSASSINAINEVGFHSTGQSGMTTSLGQINWGRLYGANLVRSTNPISIGVTGLTVDAGLSTFPTIQRKNYVNTSVRGLRSTGSIRVFGL